MIRAHLRAVQDRHSALGIVTLGWVVGVTIARTLLGSICPSQYTLVIAIARDNRASTRDGPVAATGVVGHRLAP